MERKPVIFEGKSIDYALALFFGFLALVSLSNAARLNSEALEIESFAAVPLLIGASCSFALRQAANMPAYRDEMLLPMLSFLSPFLVLNANYLQANDLSLPAASLVAIPGIVLTCISMIYLRKSFAILPSVRQLVTAGPYRYIRHPMYLGELIYVLGAMMLAFSLLSLLFFALFIVLLISRIRIEERKLMAEPAYLGYARGVRYRLIPMLY